MKLEDIIKKQTQSPVAEIIKKGNPIDDFLEQQNG